MVDAVRELGSKLAGQNRKLFFFLMGYLKATGRKFVKNFRPNSGSETSMGEEVEPGPGAVEGRLLPEEEGIHTWNFAVVATEGQYRYALKQRESSG